MQPFDWQAKYKDKVKTAPAAMKLIKSGNSIFIGTGCANRSISSMLWWSTPTTSTMPISCIC